MGYWADRHGYNRSSDDWLKQHLVDLREQIAEVEQILAERKAREPEARRIFEERWGGKTADSLLDRAEEQFQAGVRADTLTAGSRRGTAWYDDPKYDEAEREFNRQTDPYNLHGGRR